MKRPAMSSAPVRPAESIPIRIYDFLFLLGFEKLLRTLNPSS
jgi:hypothetical protein